MFARLGRTTAPLAVLSLIVIPALAGCGSHGNTADSPSGGAHVSSVTTSTGTPGWGGVTIAGSYGKAPQVKFTSQVATPAKTLQKTLHAGTGATVANGDNLNLDIWLGDGTSQKKLYSDWDKGAPEPFTDSSSTGPFWSGFLTGAKVGSRLVAITNANNVFGSAGNQSYGVGAGDSLVVVVDIVSKVKPVVPKDVAPSKLPKVLTHGSKVTGMSFKGINKPAKNPPFERVILKKGHGKPLTANSTITANYYGMTYGAKTPFDESYTKSPLTDPLANLIKGWTDGLVGVPVGSRVELQIPPSLGYGSNQSGSIPPNSTLYFVLDIISAK